MDHVEQFRRETKERKQVEANLNKLQAENASKQTILTTFEANLRFLQESVKQHNAEAAERELRANHMDEKRHSFPEGTQIQLVRLKELIDLKMGHDQNDKTKSDKTYQLMLKKRKDNEDQLEELTEKLNSLPLVKELEEKKLEESRVIKRCEELENETKTQEEKLKVESSELDRYIRNSILELVLGSRKIQDLKKKISETATLDQSVKMEINSKNAEIEDLKKKVKDLRIRSGQKPMPKLKLLDFEIFKPPPDLVVNDCQKEDLTVGSRVILSDLRNSAVKNLFSIQFELGKSSVSLSNLQEPKNSGEISNNVQSSNAAVDITPDENHSEQSSKSSPEETRNFSSAHKVDEEPITENRTAKKNRINILSVEVIKLPDLESIAKQEFIPFQKKQEIDLKSSETQQRRKTITLSPGETKQLSVKKIRSSASIQPVTDETTQQKSHVEGTKIISSSDEMKPILIESSTTDESNEALSLSSSNEDNEVAFEKPTKSTEQRMINDKQIHPQYDTIELVSTVSSSINESDKASNSPHRLEQINSKDEESPTSKKNSSASDSSSEISFESKENEINDTVSEEIFDLSLENRSQTLEAVPVQSSRRAKMKNKNPRKRNLNESQSSKSSQIQTSPKNISQEKQSKEKEFCQSEEVERLGSSEYQSENENSSSPESLSSQDKKFETNNTNVKQSSPPLEDLDSLLEEQPKVSPPESLESFFKNLKSPNQNENNSSSESNDMMGNFDMFKIDEANDCGDFFGESFRAKDDNNDETNSFF